MKLEIYLRGRYEALIYDFLDDMASKLNQDFLNHLDHGFPRGGRYPVIGDEGAEQNILLNFEAVACILSPANPQRPAEDRRLMNLQNVPDRA